MPWLISGRGIRFKLHHISCLRLPPPNPANLLYAIQHAPVRCVRQPPPSHEPALFPSSPLSDAGGCGSDQSRFTRRMSLPGPVTTGSRSRPLRESTTTETNAAADGCPGRRLRQSIDCNCFSFFHETVTHRALHIAGFCAALFQKRRFLRGRGHGFKPPILLRRRDAGTLPSGHRVPGRPAD